MNAPHIRPRKVNQLKTNFIAKKATKCGIKQN